MSRVLADDLALRLYKMMEEELAGTGVLHDIIEEFAKDNEMSEDEVEDLLDKIKNKLRFH